MRRDRHGRRAENVDEMDGGRYISLSRPGELDEQLVRYIAALL